MYTIADLLDLTHTKAAPLFEGKTYPYEVLDGIKGFILELGATLSPEEYDHPKEDVWIAKDAVIYPNNYIAGPCIIGHKTEVRPGAFVRGSAHVQVPHYNYVGDSILGYKSHMGAGSITSNVKSDKTLVVLKDGERELPTNRKKVGAVLGDYVEVGCNSVLNPGTVIGRHSNVYPTSCVRGEIPENSIFKTGARIVKKA